MSEKGPGRFKGSKGKELIFWDIAGWKSCRL